MSVVSFLHSPRRAAPAALMGFLSEIAHFGLTIVEPVSADPTAWIRTQRENVGAQVVHLQPRGPLIQTYYHSPQARGLVNLGARSQRLMQMSRARSSAVLTLGGIAYIMISWWYFSGFATSAYVGNG